MRLCRRIELEVGSGCFVHELRELTRIKKWTRIIRHVEKEGKAEIRNPKPEILDVHELHELTRIRNYTNKAWSA